MQTIPDVVPIRPDHWQADALDDDIYNYGSKQAYFHGLEEREAFGVLAGILEVN